MDTLALSTKQRFSLTPTPPFDFQHSLSVLEKMHAGGLKRTITKKVLRLAYALSDETVLLELKSSGSVQAPKLNVGLHAKRKLSKSELKDLKAYLTFYLSLDDDLTSFYALAESDPAFESVLKALYGFHPVKFPSVFASACWALVTQRTPNSFAFKTMTRLSELLGTRLEHDGETYTTFPEPQAFLGNEASEAILEATNNTRKTERLLAIAQSFAEADEDFLRTAPYAEVAAWLGNVHGLGAWSVDYIMLRGLGRYERSPWTDTRIMHTLSEIYTLGFSMSKGDARALAERYGWQQGLWVHYLKTFEWLGLES